MKTLQEKIEEWLFEYVEFGYSLADKKASIKCNIQYKGYNKSAQEIIEIINKHREEQINSMDTDNEKQIDLESYLNDK